VNQNLFTIWCPNCQRDVLVEETEDALVAIQDCDACPKCGQALRGERQFLRTIALVPPRTKPRRQVNQGPPLWPDQFNVPSSAS